MKKYFTIPAAMMIFLSGMHFTVASHYCGGEAAATRVSVSGKVASCGMIHEVIPEPSSGSHFTSNCCENEVSVYTVDNYTPSAFHLKEITPVILQNFQIPEGLCFQNSFPLFTIRTNFSPPDNYLATAVIMADICVFRI